MPSGSELARRCYESARHVDPGAIIWNELVDIFAREVSDLGLMKFVLPSETFSPIAWRDVPVYVTGLKDFVPSSRSYAVHLYNEMWRRNRLDKWHLYPPSSVLNILCRHAKIAAEDIYLKPNTAARRGVMATLKRLWSFNAPHSLSNSVEVEPQAGL